MPASQRAGSRALSLAVADRLWIAAARRPARSEPVNSQFFFADGNRADGILDRVVVCALLRHD